MHSGRSILQKKQITAIHTCISLPNIRAVHERLFLIVVSNWNGYIRYHWCVCREQQRQCVSWTGSTLGDQRHVRQFIREAVPRGTGQPGHCSHRLHYHGCILYTHSCIQKKGTVVTWHSRICGGGGGGGGGCARHFGSLEFHFQWRGKGIFSLMEATSIIISKQLLEHFKAE